MLFSIKVGGIEVQLKTNILSSAQYLPPAHENWMKKCQNMLVWLSKMALTSVRQRVFKSMV
jgi:hypothetical protein